MTVSSYQWLGSIIIIYQWDEPVHTMSGAYREIPSRSPHNAAAAQLWLSTV